MTGASSIHVRVSGQTVVIDGVLFHSAAAVRRWQGLLAKAQPMLAGFSTGIGIWGSPGVALAGAAAIGFLEAAVTESRQKQGLQLLAEASQAHDRLRPRGTIVPVAQISGIETPDVSYWKAHDRVLSEADVRNMGMFDKLKLRNEWGATDEEIKSGFVRRETMQDLIVLPDSFVTCLSGDRTIQIKWSTVDIYELV